MRHDYSQSDQKIVAIVGTLWEKAYGQVARIHEVEVVCRNLNSNPGNWEDIISQIQSVTDKNDAKVLIRLTAATLVRAASGNYGNLLFKMLGCLKLGKHAILIHKSLLEGDLVWLDEQTSSPITFATPYEEIEQVNIGNDDEPFANDVDLNKHKQKEDFFVKVWRQSGLVKLMRKLKIDEDPATLREAIKELIDYLRTSHYLIIPFSSSADVTGLCVSFIEGDLLEENTIRFFVSPSLAEKRELMRLTDLVREYCSTIGLTDVQISRSDTKLGTHIVFTVKSPQDALVRMQDVFGAFSQLLAACEHNVEDAIQALEAAGIEKSRAEDICDHLNIEGRRLSLDLDITKRKRLLDLEYGFRESLIGGEVPAAPPQTSHTPSQQSLLITSGTVNVINQFGGYMNIARNLDLDEAESDLLAAIQEHSAGLEATTLQADVVAMGDPEIPQREKVSAYGRLKKFLHRHSGKIEDLSTKVLAAWLESKLTGH